MKRPVRMDGAFFCEADEKSEGERRFAAICRKNLPPAAKGRAPLESDCAFGEGRA